MGYENLLIHRCNIYRFSSSSEGDTTWGNLLATTWEQLGQSQRTWGQLLAGAPPSGTPSHEMSYGVVVTRRPRYGVTPFASNVRCYVPKLTRSRAFVVHAAPNTIINDTTFFHFTKGQDVRVNDLIEYEGARYTVRSVYLVRKHHKEVEAERVENL